jgi:hypothetical protein
MTGEISQSLLSLQHLEFLDLSWNSLQQGPTMEFLGSFKTMHSTTMPNLNNLCNLTVLHPDGCFWYGNITELIERLPKCSSKKVAGATSTLKPPGRVPTKFHGTLDQFSHP